MPRVWLVVAVLLTVGICHDAAAEGYVQAKKGYYFGSEKVSSADAVCRGLNDGKVRSVDRAKDHGTSVDCKIRVPDGTEREQHTGSIEWECPPNSTKESERRCLCDDGFVASGSQCTASAAKDAPAASPKGDTASPDKRDAPSRQNESDCQLDQHTGAALKGAIVELVQRYTDEQNQFLINDPKAAGNLFPNIGRGAFTGDYGTLLENLTARRVKQDLCLSKYIEHVPADQQSKPGPNGEKGSHPDFKGKKRSVAKLEIDITTEEAATRKRATDGGKANYEFVTYQRGLCLDAKTKIARKITSSMDKSKMKNGACP